MGALNRPQQEKPRDQGRGGSAALREGEDHMQIMVPDRTVGLIIGRGGETIRDLQERSGGHINIVGESKSVNGLRRSEDRRVGKEWVGRCRAGWWPVHKNK